MGETQGLLKDRYRLLELIGEGGMAAVHAAHDTTLGRDVAIKLFAPSTDDEVLARQEEEVAVLASLSHHGLVTLFDAGIDRRDRKHPRFFLVMELVLGADLQRSLIASGPLSGRHVAQIGYDIAEALQYVHHSGVVHRDIKPSNILLVDYDDESTRTRAKLTDFGIALRGVEKQDKEATTSGTAAYLSPEQVRKEEVGPPTDIYSLGLVLLECFTGELTYPGEPIESAVARLRTRPPIPSSLSSDWRSLLTSMTEADPAARPDAKEAVLALRQLSVAELGRHTLEAEIEFEEPTQPTAPAQIEQLEHKPRENPFDRITALASRVLSAPFALMSLDDSGREWFMSQYGIDIDETNRQRGRYSSAILYQQPWTKGGAEFDPMVLADPLNAARLGLNFHASAPLVTSDGTRIATLCVLDFEPRTITGHETETLKNLAALAIAEFERRLDAYLSTGGGLGKTG